MSFSLGDTFLNKSSSGIPQHLWIIISHLTYISEQLVIVNFTTYQGFGGEDQSCLLDKAEHPFIKHKTYVNYRDAKVVQIHNLEKLQTTGLITRMTPVTNILLAKILEGAEQSPFLKFEIRKILEDQDII